MDALYATALKGKGTMPPKGGNLSLADADVKAVEEHGKTGVTDATGAWVDLAWALINSPEFLLRH